MRQANVEGARVENVKERDLQVSNPEAMVRSHVMDFQPKRANDEVKYTFASNERLACVNIGIF